MLNISKNSINEKFPKSRFSSLKTVEAKESRRVLIRITNWTLFGILVLGFLPWTQNIRSLGNVSTLKPDQRPQTIHSIIAGRVEHWYVQEGDFVKKRRHHTAYFRN